MKDYLIIEYVKKLTIDDVKNFAKLKNINISDSDAIILYTYIKNHYQELLNNDSKIIKEIKDQINPDTFKEVYKLYLEYKIKYLS